MGWGGGVRGRAFVVGMVEYCVVVVDVSERRRCPSSERVELLGRSSRHRTVPLVARGFFVVVIVFRKESYRQ